MIYLDQLSGVVKVYDLRFWLCVYRWRLQQTEIRRLACGG